MNPSIPKVRVKKLKPAFERDKHLGPVTRRQAINRINADADRRSISPTRPQHDALHPPDTNAAQRLRAAQIVEAERT